MAEKSEIAWTNATFNPWIGCAKVSPGCANCYASTDTFARRSRANGRELWGVNAERHETSDAYWREPAKWNRAAERDGVRRRVFCGSLCDVFEDREDLRATRARLWRLVYETPHLDWLLLTKRPENADRLWRDARSQLGTYASEHIHAGPLWLPNVWLGTTAEDQRRADERIPQLLATPAAVRFVSVEPQLEHVSLDRFFGLAEGARWAECLCAEIDPSDRPCLTCEGRRSLGAKSGLHWVIQGGESGHNARPFDIAWARSMRDQCRAAGVAWFFKQAGANPHDSAEPRGRRADVIEGRWIRHPKGGDPSEWPEDLRVREFPEVRDV